MGVLRMIRVGGIFVGKFCGCFVVVIWCEVDFFCFDFGGGFWVDDVFPA